MPVMWHPYLCPASVRWPVVGRDCRRVPLPGVGAAACRDGFGLVRAVAAGPSGAGGRSGPDKPRAHSWLARRRWTRRAWRVMQAQPQAFGLSAPRRVVGQGEHLHPRGEFKGEGDDRDPDLVVGEAVQRQVGQAGGSISIHTRNRPSVRPTHMTAICDLRSSENGSTAMNMLSAKQGWRGSDSPSWTMGSPPLRITPPCSESATR